MKVGFTRASTEALIHALMTCDDDEGVCEMCAAIQEKKQLTTVWIGEGNSEEGVDLCCDCKAKGARDAC